MRPPSLPEHSASGSAKTCRKAHDCTVEILQNTTLDKQSFKEKEKLENHNDFIVRPTNATPSML